MGSDREDGRVANPADRLAEVYDVLGPLYRNAVRAVEADGMAVGVRAVLDYLRAHEAATVPQLARTLALSRQFVQRMVNDAVDRRWVRVRRNPHHRRSSLIEITAAGRRTVAAVAERERATLREMGAGLSHQQVDSCLVVLRQMLGHLRERNQT